MHACLVPTCWHQKNGYGVEVHPPLSTVHLHTVETVSETSQSNHDSIREYTCSPTPDSASHFSLRKNTSFTVKLDKQIKNGKGGAWDEGARHEYQA